MFYTFFSGLANLLASPLVHCSMVIALCLLLKKMRSTNNKMYNILIGGSLCWLLFCSLPFTSTLLIHGLEHHYPSIDVQDEEWKSADAIVVLACSFYDDDALPLVSRWHDCSMKRNLQAALMYKEKATPIYLSGGPVDKTDYTHAQFNLRFFKQMGIPEEHIILSQQGHNTASEAAGLLPLLQGKTIALVPSASHQIRAVEYFRHQSVTIIPIPVEHLSRYDIEPMIGRPSARSLYRSERAMHEYLGILAQRLSF